MTGKKSRTVVATVAALVAVALILWLDRVTPNEYSFEIFYVIPVLAITLAAGRSPGVLVAVVGGIAWTVDTVEEDGFVASAVAWNILTRAAIFIGVVILVDLYNKRGSRVAPLHPHPAGSVAL